MGYPPARSVTAIGSSGSPSRRLSPGCPRRRCPAPGQVRMASPSRPAPGVRDRIRDTIGRGAQAGRYLLQDPGVGEGHLRRARRRTRGHLAVGGPDHAPGRTSPPTEARRPGRLRLARHPPPECPVRAPARSVARSAPAAGAVLGTGGGRRRDRQQTLRGLPRTESRAGDDTRLQRPGPVHAPRSAGASVPRAARPATGGEGSR